MKISLNWLKDYIDIPSSPAELGQILTSLGLEVEGIEEVMSIPGGLNGLVVGEVKSCNKHPNADRLSVTTVDIGAEENLNIVCGAPNVAVGQKVIVAPVGTTLYPTAGDPFKIKKGKIRGVVSEGMICSEDEVGLGNNHEGIVELHKDAVVGSLVAEHFDLKNDVVYDIGLTPNRSDATSHIGVARDLLAYYRYHGDLSLILKEPESDYQVALKENKQITVEIRDRAKCPRFTGLTISNVKVGPSPEWIQKRLSAVGVRPISNVVDITNYVLHEYGQPLHAYDFSKIAKKSIHVQTLPSGTKFQSLDEKERVLHEEDLVICDGDDKGMCIAGVFGGIDSGVTEATTDIFLEAAHFEANTIRKTSTRHLLRTDAAICFEKGADPSNTAKAIKRAASLLTAFAGAKVSSEIIDVYPNVILPNEIEVRKKRINTLIGTELSDTEITNILRALDIEIISQDKEKYKVAIPTNKFDVDREIDVIEEILRIYGFDNVPVPSKLNVSISISEKIDLIRLREIIANLLTNKGYSEMKGLSLIPSSLYSGMGNYENQLVKINNTSNIQLDAMRPEMLFSALVVAKHNINRQQKDLAFFESGHSYISIKEEYIETEWLTIVRSGEAFANNWRQDARNIDFFDVKESVLAIFERLGVQSFQSSELDDDRFDYGLSYNRGPLNLVNFGLISAQSKKALDIDVDIFYAELHVKNILKVIKKNTVNIKSIPKFPSSRRDLALTLDNQVKYDVLKNIIAKNGGSMLKEISLFDIYKDKNQLGEEKKSYAISMIFEDSEKNLKDKDIDKIVNKVVRQLESEVGAKLR